MFTVVGFTDVLCGEVGATTSSVTWLWVAGRARIQGHVRRGARAIVIIISAAAAAAVASAAAADTATELVVATAAH